MLRFISTFVIAFFMYQYAAGQSILDESKTTIRQLDSKGGKITYTKLSDSTVIYGVNWMQPMQN